MIKMLHRDGRAAPVIVCDICGDMIGSADEGAAVFASTLDQKQHSKTDVLHAHKGKCHDQAEGRFKDAGWDELAMHLYRIVLNSGVDFALIDRRERRFDGEDFA